MTDTDIPNFKELPDVPVWRGGQPTIVGWLELQALGIQTVIKLNEESEGSDDPARNLGMNVICCPISLAEQTVGEPPETMLDLAVDSIATNTFVHCEHGQDRTGLVVGLWRIRKCGWTYRAAMDEMLACGFHPLLRGLCWAIDQYST